MRTEKTAIINPKGSEKARSEADSSLLQDPAEELGEFTARPVTAYEDCPELAERQSGHGLR